MLHKDFWFWGVHGSHQYNGVLHTSEGVGHIITKYKRVNIGDVELMN